MNYSGYSKLIEKIAAVIGSRKLVLRYKNTALENELLEKAGLKASFYVTGEANKVNNIDSFPESVLEGKQDEYLLPIIADGMLKEGTEFTVLPTDDHWFGVTFKEDQAGVEESFRKLIESGVYRADLYSDL